MRRFNENAACPKCGGTKVTAMFCGKYPAYSTVGHGLTPCHNVHRHCTRCHYEWTELPLDAEPAPSAKETKT